MQPGTAGIGTLRERPLHADLKRWYTQAGDELEVAVDGYVVDIVRGEHLIEIQTRSFAKMRGKLEALLARGFRVRIVHPVAVDRWIVQVDADGALLGRRRSPRHGAISDVAAELVSFPELLAHPGLELEVLLIAEEEYRRHEAGRCWRRKGWVTLERRLVEVLDRVVLAGPQDLARLLPLALPERFTTHELALLLRRPRRAAQQLAYCLRRAGVVEELGKRGHVVEYGRVAAGPASPAMGA